MERSAVQCCAVQCSAMEWSTSSKRAVVRYIILKIVGLGLL